MLVWDDVVNELTAVDGDLDRALGVPLVAIAQDLRSSRAFSAALQRFIRTLGVQTVAELLDDERTERIFAAKLEAYERSAVASELPDFVERWASLARRSAPTRQPVAARARPPRRPASAPPESAPDPSPSSGPSTTPSTRPPPRRLPELDPAHVPPAGVALERWLRHFGIDAAALRVHVRVSTYNTYAFRAVDLVDPSRAPALGPAATITPGQLRDAGIDALQREAHRAAERLALRAAYAARRAEPDEPALLALLATLRAALDDLPPPPLGLEDAPLFRYPAREVTFRARPPALVVTGRRLEEAPIAVDLDSGEACVLAGHLRPSTIVSTRSAHDELRRAVLLTAIDVLCDPSAEARRELAVWAATPRWRHALDALDGTLRARGLDGSEARRERLAFRIAAGSFVPPELLLQAPRKGGGFTPGRLASPADVARQVALDPLEREILGLRQALLRDGAEAEEPMLERLVDLLGRHPRVLVEGSGDAVRVRRARPVLVPVPEGDGTHTLALTVEGRAVPRPAPGARAHAWLDPARAEVHVALLDEVSAALLETVAASRAAFPLEGLEALHRAVAHHEHLRLDVELPEALRGDPITALPRPVARLTLRSGASVDVALRLRPWPAGPLLVPGQGPRTVLGTSASGARVHAQRDHAAEVARVGELAALIAPGVALDDASNLTLDDPNRAADLLVALAARADDVDAEWEGPAITVRTASPSDLRVRIDRKRDWFAVDGSIEIDDVKVTLAALLAAVRGKRRFVRAAGGDLVALGEELRGRLARLDDALVEERGKLLAGPHAVDVVGSLVEDGSQIAAAKEWIALRERWAAARRFEPTVPRKLRATLRPYQVDGHAWLARLAACGVAGCLADDMGLGKTLQALALLVTRAAEGPALVLAPTSVTGNWESEAARFAPSLRVALYRGAGRAHHLTKLGARDVVVCSYDILVRDAEALAAIRFATVVFDEAHAMKNSQSKRAAAARGLDGAFRLALTGTPVENHLGELWSLFRVLMPALFGPWERFRDRFALPIERDRDPDRRQALAAMVRPYLLRRTKQQVAPELPPRTEIVREVELSAEERALYEAERRATLDALAGGRGRKDLRFVVLAGILRLRQLACHPRLRDDASPVRSSKLESALELLEEIRDAGHKVLVFSQFTSHLAIVAAALRERGFTLLELDGSTPAAARTERVARFQAGEADAFLISLKAGGVGLNLTAADYVLHLDPWWNPAAEDQASDRAHRIGQRRSVTIVRLIARGTIEEKVLALHAEKRDLADAVLAGGDASGGLSTGELIDLMA